MEFPFHFGFCHFDLHLLWWRSLHHSVEQLQQLYSSLYPTSPLLCNQLSTEMLPGKQQQSTRGKPHLQLHHPTQNPNPFPAFWVPSSVLHSATAFQRSAQVPVCSAASKNVPLNPTWWPDFQRCWSLLPAPWGSTGMTDVQPRSKPSAFPSFYVLRITGLSNHVAIDYYCYYLLNSYFLLLGWISHFIDLHNNY